MILDKKDIVSAILEGITIVLVFVDLFAILKDKVLKGSRIWPKFYWFGYGAWGSYLLYLLHLPISCTIAIISEIIYLGYIALCIYFKYKNK